MADNLLVGRRVARRRADGSTVTGTVLAVGMALWGDYTTFIALVALDSGEMDEYEARRLTLLPEDD